MKELIDTLKKHNLRTNSYETRGKAIIINSNKGKLVLKKRTNNIFDYLETRSFDYFPKYIKDDQYNIMEYIEDVEMPKEQKMLDLINLVSLLHNKTTYYKNVDEDDYKKHYEDIKNNINYLFNYYTDLMNIIETKIHMSPSEFLLATNISIVFNALRYCEYNLDSWYKDVLDKNRRRYVVIHNNLDLNHFIRNSNAYLLSWDKARMDIPVYDLYTLYKKYALEYDFKDLFNVYEKKYPLLKDEKKLLYVLISIPDKIELSDSIYDDCARIERFLDYLYKTEILISPENSEKTK